MRVEPPQRFFNALLSWMVERVEDPEEFKRVLYEPPPHRPLTERVVQDEAAGFAAFASAFGVPTPTKRPVPSHRETEVTTDG